MATAKKLPSGNWRCRVFAGTNEQGKKVYESFTAPTKRETESDAALWLSHRKQRHNAQSGPTLGDAIDAYLDTCRSIGMSPSTIYSYLSCRKNSYPLLIHHQIHKLTLSDIQRQVNQRAKVVRPKTIRNELGLLSVVLQQYEVDLKLSTLKLPKPEHQEMQIPTDAQLMQLLDMSESNNNLYISIMLAALMGLRRSEICALTWDDIDRESHMLFVHHGLVRNEDGGLTLKDPKTAAGKRCLSIPNSVFAELMHRRTMSSRIVTCHPSTITDSYKHLTEKLGISGRFHDLRHYHASSMIAVGMPEKYIVSDMGHSTFNMVRNVYGHIKQEKKISVDTAIAHHADAIMSRKSFSYDTEYDTSK